MTEKKFHDNEIYNKILFETENFSVIPSLGSIVAGWLLIIPKQHYISIGAIDNMQLFEELDRLIQHIGDIVKDTFGDYVIFENGSYCHNKLVGCGVDYAHIHVVPTDLDLIGEISSRFNIKYDWKTVDNIKVAISYIKSNKPYLYYRNQLEQSFITTNNNIPSQLFRKAIAESIGLSDKYDWKQDSFIENIKETIRTYSKYSEITV